MSISESISPSHLARRAVVYVRQSSPNQTITNQESLKLQYKLMDRARTLATQGSSFTMDASGRQSLAAERAFEWRPVLLIEEGLPEGLCAASQGIVTKEKGGRHSRRR